MKKGKVWGRGIVEPKRDLVVLNGFGVPTAILLPGMPHVGSLLEFYILATSTIISAWVSLLLVLPHWETGAMSTMP